MPERPESLVAQGISPSAEGDFFRVGVGNMERKGGVVVPPCVPRFPFAAQTLGSFSPLAFAAAPRWGSSNPLEHCPSVVIS